MGSAMREKPPSSDNPVAIAREAFSRLAKERITPTPDNYRDLYNEISGIASESNADTVLETFAKQLQALPGNVAAVGEQLTRALKTRDWADYSANLTALCATHLQPKPVVQSEPVAIIATPAPVAKIVPPAPVDVQVKMLRDMLSRTLAYAIPPLVLNAPELVTEAEAVAADCKLATNEQALNDVAARLKKLCFKLDIKGADLSEQHELLLQLFRLLLENVGELIDNESWLHSQVEAVQKLLSGPITRLALKDAATSLKEVIYQQGLLKHNLAEAKVSVKSMMLTFIERAGAVAASTGDYHEKIDQYSQKITLSQDIKELNKILDDVMRETRVAQAEALRSRDDMIRSREEMQEAEHRIHALESQLERMTELVREDPLTGSLNRRGLNEVLERELARADRHAGNLCLAMLDLDDFKRLNDNHGHIAGDGALVHLVTVVKETLRTLDVVGRFGGEEFVVILPDTTLDTASQAITRLQRELTKQIFMINNERLLITFSAGVASRKPSEDATSLIKRADDALYEAKKAGKNRVAVAE
jgi:diguanylate cyclase